MCAAVLWNKMSFLHYIFRNPLDILRDLYFVVMNFNDLRAFTQVTGDLYVCAGSMVNDSNLANRGITLVVNATNELKSYVPPYGSNIRVVRVPVLDRDMANLYPFFKPVSDLVRANAENGGKTVIHCMCGVSRSVSLCAAYLILNCKSQQASLSKSFKFSSYKTASSSTATMGTREACEYLRKKRSIARPNPGFMSQLVKLECAFNNYKETKDASQLEVPASMLKPEERAAIDEIKTMTRSIKGT